MKMRIKPYSFLAFIALILMIGMNSCVSKKEIVYFQDSGKDTMLVTDQKYNIVFQPGDILTILVSAMDLESVQPFNMPVVAFNAGDGRLSGAQKLQDYLIDPEGYIDFPVLGKIKLKGLNRTQATKLLQEKIKKYVKEPIVNIRLTNFKITVLGEVMRPGTYVIKNERLTLPEALGLAGDMKITGRRDNVLVVRDIDGVQYKYRVNLTSDEVFSSPVYFLRQNDVVYVEPKESVIKDSTFGKSTSVFFSLTSTVISVILLIHNLSK